MRGARALSRHASSRGVQTLAYTWGSGSMGQLGHALQGENSAKTRDGKYIERVPRSVDGLLDSGVAQVVCGADHSIAVTKDGEVYAWGSNDYGQLGFDSDKKNVNVPKKVVGLEGHTVVQVDASHYHSAALTSEGEVFTWGWGGGTSAKDVFQDALFGSGGIGALGHGDLEDRAVPTRVEALVEDGIRVKHVSCGKSHTVVLTEDGMVWSWGKGDSGRLGHCSTEDFMYPEPVEILNEELGPCSQISCGESFTLALAGDGVVYSWGKNECGQLGLDATMDMHSFENYPQPIEAFEMEGIEIAQICAGAKHSAAISTEGRVYTWGDKIHAQPEPVLALDDVGVTQVACGFKYTAAVDANGDLHTWGSVGWFGQSALGHAAKSSMRDPSRLATLEEAGVRVTHVAAGSSHCAAVAAPR